MNKKTTEAFGKKIYLLGQDEGGVNYWMEAPSFDCEWYWGFGYIETYTNNQNPEKSKDIDSHSHFSGLFPKGKFHVNEFFTKTPLTDKEAWELSDLMKSFYTLKETAEVFHRGGSNLSGSNGITQDLKDEELEKIINEVKIPLIFERIDTILSSDK